LPIMQVPGGIHFERIFFRRPTGGTSQCPDMPVCPKVVGRNMCFSTGHHRPKAAENQAGTANASGFANK